MTQSRIKRLYAYSTISHVGFILLALSINSAESVQSYIFYILQYSLSNLNAFIILVAIGFSFYLQVKNAKENKEELVDENNSPVQLINQMKGYFYVNPFIAISLSITLFSFVGVPPVIGFFAKQMVLSAALDDGYIFMALLAIITSVIGAAYYLSVIKQIFFFKGDNEKLHSLDSNGNETNMVAYVLNDRRKDENVKKLTFNTHSITLNSSLSTTISVITLLLVLFIYVPTQ